MNGKGLRLGGVAVLAAVQLIAAAPTSAAHRTPTDVGRTYPVRSNSTARPHPVRHHGFFRRHSQISVGTTITTGWNLITVPVLGSISSASALAASMNDASQLGAGAVTTIATYSSGQYHLYIPSYSPDLPLQPEQGIWVYSSKSGTWHASGAAFQTSAPINLQTGWNLVGLPYPTSGLTTTQIAGQVGGSAVQRMALYQGGNYTTWQTGQSGFSVPAGTGVWLYSTTATTWSPQAIVTPPPNPTDVATVTDPTVATGIDTATSFLYSGNNPIQTGVAPGTINTLRVTVLRGKVLNRDGSALAGATVTILNHPEFGQTISRADGGYDMAVNGGSELVLNFGKDGFLPAQRQVSAPWQDYAPVDDVALVPSDPKVTPVTFGSGTTAIQTVQGSPRSDSNGTRRETVLIPAATTASMTLPDGTSQAVSGAHIRATEFTVGSTGPTAMPATLPPSSAYTYCVSLSLDEAQAAGATSVQFNQPVLTYHENVLGIPIGALVPVGYYDLASGTWKAEHNGIVIKILSVTNGLADIDLAGSGVPADAATLARFGFTDAERGRLATLYAPGTSLWRASITHFSDHDENYGPVFLGPRTGILAGVPFVNQATSDNIATALGFGTLDLQNQVFGESAHVSGTPFSLNYRSNRQVGYTVGNVLSIPISGAAVPTELVKIEVDVTVAGRIIEKTFPATANQTYAFSWDGKDAYGRLVQGAQRATVDIVYFYPVQYGLPPNAVPTTGALFRTLQSTGTSTRRAVSVAVYETPLFATGASLALLGGHSTNFSLQTVLRRQYATLGPWDAHGEGLGGWTLNVHHTYDPTSKTLYLGSGMRRSAASLNNVIGTVAGNGSYGGGGDGGPATQAQLYNNDTLAVGPDGTLYTSSGQLSRVRRVDPSGIINAFAGGGAYYRSNCAQQTDQFGDGCPATQAYLNGNQSVATGPDGSVYIADTYNQRIRKVDANGIISTVAGSGPVVDFCGDVQHTCVEGAFSGDGGPATQAHFNFPHDVAVGRDGSIYVDDSGNNRIRRVGPDGIISTVAGNGTVGYTPDDQPAIGAAMNISNPSGIAVGRDGSLYILEANNDVIRKVTPDGILHTVAGDPSNHSAAVPADGAAATSGGFGNPGAEHVAMGPDGTLYVSVDTYWQGCTVRQITPDGIERAVAGAGCGFGGDGGPATGAQMQDANGMAVAPDGSIYVADRQNERIRHVAAAFPGLNRSDLLIPSEDGSQVYRFDANGRHLSTLNALTNAVVYQFGYDTAGHLSSVTDGDGNVTNIKRDANGNPLDITGPYGQVTALGLDSAGNLVSVTDPAGKATTFGYGAGALLTKVTGPRNDTYTFSYETQGRLVTAADPAGGLTSLGSVENATGRAITVTSPTGTTTTYRLTLLPSGNRQEVTTHPDGTATTYDIATNGTVTTTFPDGTIDTLVTGPDPRFGMQAPIAATHTVSTPKGLKSSTTLTSAVTLADNTNSLSLTGQTDTVTANGRTTTTIYDTSTHTFTTTSPSGRQSSATTDPAGRPIEVRPEGVAPFSYAYDTRGRLTSMTQGTGTGARTTVYTYGNDGYLRSTTDALGRLHSYGYDSAGHMINETLSGGRTLSYTYDAEGNVTSATLPNGQVHRFTVTPVGLPSTYMPPTVPTGGAPTQNAYNASRQLTGVTRPDARAIGYGHDTAGRLSTVSLARGQITSMYDGTSGNLASLTSPDGVTESYSYDGGLLTDVTVGGPVAGSISRAYDSDLRLANESVNSGSAMSFTYDNNSLISQAGPLSISRDSVTGLATGTTLGTVATTTSHNSFAEPLKFTAAAGGTQVFDQQYIRDANGRVAQMIETVDGSTNTYTYAYDMADRLAAVRKNGTLIDTYGYDANGNRTTTTDASGSTVGTYDAQDRLSQYGGNSYTYNANGDRTGKTLNQQTTNYQYDEAGTLLTASLPSSTQISYLIDARNRRIGKKVDGTLVQGFLYADGVRPIAELDGSNNVVSQFIYTVAASVPDFMVKGGVAYRIIADQTGSPRLIVNTQSGAIVQRLDYDAFGRIVRDTNPGFQPFGFAGGLYDRDTGLVRIGARDYDPEIGRWTTKDPLQFGGGDTNLYGYVFNDPINLVDPTGAGPGSRANPRDVTEEEFRAQIGQKLINIRKNQGVAGGLEFIPQAVMFDSKYYNGSSKDDYYQFRGRVMQGRELNYYFQGMLFNAYEIPEVEMNGFIRGWKASYALAGHYETPSANTWWAAHEGYSHYNQDAPNSRPFMFNTGWVDSLNY